MNLLPFLPLDGGRLALALIEKRTGRARAQRTLSLFGIIFGVLLFCAGVMLVSAADSAFNPTPLAAGFFIFISALSEFRCSCGSNIKASLAGLSRLRSGSAVRVVPIALRSDCTVRKALSFIGGRGYGIIFVVEAGATVGILDENIVLNAALRGESDAELRTLLPQALCIVRTEFTCIQAINYEPSHRQQVQHMHRAAHLHSKRCGAYRPW